MITMGKPSDDQSVTMERKRALLPIRAKLAAAILVPLVAVAGLSMVQVNQARDRRTAVEEETRLAGVALNPGSLVDALIVEQGDATVSILGMRDTAVFPTDSFEESVAETDQALADLKKAVASGGPVAKRIFATPLADIEDNLADQRARLAGPLKNPGLDNWDVTEVAYDSYSLAINNLLNANEQIASSISDPDMREAAETLNDVTVAHFAVSNLMKKVGTSLASDDPMARYNAAGDLRDYEQAVENLRAHVNGPWGEAVSTYASNPVYSDMASMVSTWLQTGDLVMEDLIGLNPKVTDRKTAELGTTQRIASDASKALQKMIDQRVSDAKAEQQRYTMIAVAVMIGAAAAAMAVAASILRPMRKLTSQAEEMATTGLPQAVQGVLNTPPHEDVVLPDLAPVTVRSHDELQTVASAINHVQSSALDLAVEQATLRRNIADSFVSLGRRTQNLIGLQLELITELEEAETDPAVLESLYKLDHLATRARRNAESLVVLGGTEAQRGGGVPVAMTDVVRASLSEVEAYQRVTLEQVDTAYIPGSSAADLIHLLAELVENGLSFSPPTTQVEVTGRRDANGYRITVTDHGVGMTPDRIGTANRRLSGNESFTVAPSRYLGHYVAGRLAARMGAKVALSAGQGGGVIATVEVPLASLMSDAEATKAIEQAAQAAAAPAPTRGRAKANDVHPDPTNADVKVDGRPPASPATAPAAPAAPAASAEPAKTTGGLAKRVPGSHAKAVAERSPLLRSAAVNAERGPLKAETTPQETQNLAALLTDYTAGMERAKGESPEPAVTGAEPD